MKIELFLRREAIFTFCSVIVLNCSFENKLVVIKRHQYFLIAKTKKNGLSYLTVRGFKSPAL